MLHGVTAYVVFRPKYCWAQIKDTEVRTYITRGRQNIYLEAADRFREARLIR